jgi:phenylalanyl-tRNA synthetase beta chain
MRLPLSWLNEFVKVDDLDPKELAEKLTRAGLQVEAIETVGGSTLSDLIVVADVVACEPHPGSDHLKVCRVSDGAETYQVVCGAPNMRQGIKTAFAKIGAEIPAFLDKNGKPEKIKKGRLRGVESFGMCCSEAELKIGDGAAGIIEYPADTPAGTPVRDVAGLEKPETVFEVEVTWNRPDALSVVGLAREFAALLGRPLSLPPVDFAEDAARPVAGEVSVVVEDPVKCPRYTARVVTGVADGPSPAWMAKRLELCGVRPLGLCVDVTNYVMLELGQPMHAFDHTRLKDRTVVVRTAREGEKIVTLDGVERALAPTMLAICDTESPKAVAGVMGGEESGVAEGTKSLLLESALFDPASVKDTATRLGLSSESSYRYIRGVDKDLADFASRRAAHLLQKHGRATVAAGLLDVDNRARPLNPDVAFRFDSARRLIGIPVGNDEMVALLRGQGLVPRTEAPSYEGVASLAFGVPSWRWDLSLEADLVEEVARLYGLDNIPDAMPAAPSVSSLDDRAFRARTRVRDVCLALGFTEAMHYSFLSKKELDDFDPRAPENRLAIPDPVSADYSVMRDSLLPQVMGSLGRNAAHLVETAQLFEIGKVFASAAPASGEGARVPCESERLALGFVGPVGREALRRRVAVTEEEAVLWMKGAVEELVAKLHAGRVTFAPAEHPAFAKGAALSVVLNGRPVGVLGALSAKRRHPYRLTTQMALAELELKPLLKKTDVLGRVSPAPQFPLVRRDVALVAAAGVANEAIVSTICRHGGKNLVKAEVFDIFKSRDFKDGRRSLAYALEFRSPEKTLTDEEVGGAFRAILDALNAMEGVDVREGADA